MTFFRCRTTVLATLAIVAAALVGGAFAQQAPPAPTVPRPVVPAAPVPPPPDIDAKSWVLMDYATGRILASKDPNKRVIPASITKIMTDYVVSAEIAAGKVHMNDKVFISKHAWQAGGAGTDGSTSFLKVNSEVPLKDLLYGMIIQSGNDSAIALAEHVAGSEGAFAALMNAYAKQLGMSGTHYSNASGYPVPNHYTTARDVAVLSRALIHNFPADYAISAIKEFKWNGITQHNRNTLLWRDPSVDGIKTGHTSAAGYCLAASAKRGDQRLIAIVMGATTEQGRADDAQALLNYGFRFFETHKVYTPGKALATPRLWKGEADKLPIGVAEPVLVTVKRGEYDKLKATMDIPDPLIAPFKKDQKIGTLRITLDGKPVLTQPLVALQDAPEGGFFSRLWDTILLWFHHSSHDKKDAK
ncbi:MULTISPECIES: D-alanyl-D-alanine carboxypeptidase family protein [Oleiagrimonas]|jgi:serine-type D-Ala-D-Ala carboxypeptidase (penicillin-binding protein 5/6)|uniref:serine-type D-Ala-D-Ala carboxypeptidase n=1 Tax=Oleiagrimonas citrea TaxID=1665687 RepID=A0A846ZLN3_9GAMM|nr:MULTISPECIES: D-alanyl-D-alanine carboxypeptidase family protein [Oleiagrimonas]NKZ38450.1 D-alanyl-D-alanine carboxypeptidase [Oleiagrimonas citrea]RAP58290.1 serine-type D-Ala-D-Ala carboxypeptidase [Oleiagrimonas sp. MCCC 1A03011]